MQGRYNRTLILLAVTGSLTLVLLVPHLLTLATEPLILAGASHFIGIEYPRCNVGDTVWAVFQLSAHSRLRVVLR